MMDVIFMFFSQEILYPGLTKKLTQLKAEFTEPPSRFASEETRIF